jgi:hypothetical protein
MKIKMPDYFSDSGYGAGGATGLEICRLCVIGLKNDQYSRNDSRGTSASDW